MGGFGLSSEDDLLYVQDFITVEQTTSSVTVEFADTAVADYFDSCVDAGIPPARFARIWCHTHPGASPDPSSVDERTEGVVCPAFTAGGSSAKHSLLEDLRR